MIIFYIFVLFLIGDVLIKALCIGGSFCFESHEIFLCFGYFFNVFLCRH